MTEPIPPSNQKKTKKQADPAQYDQDLDTIIQTTEERSSLAMERTQGELVGKMFDRYKVEERIGRGAMAQVYRIYHPGLKKHYALKLMGATDASVDQIDESSQKRFVREAQMAAKLSHSNIVSVSDVGFEGGRLYLIMEYIDGIPLDAFVRRKKPAPEACIKIVAKLAHALDYAHKEGVIHRDLKPGNVMINRRGEPKLTDFGLAKPVDVDAGLTQSGTILGTPSYMAPEQAQGRNDDINALTDVYGLGAILYFMLTNRSPIFEKNVMATLMAVVRKEIAPPSKYNPKVPRKIDQICLKAMQKKPQNRFASSGQMAKTIDMYINSKNQDQATIVQEGQSLDELVNVDKRPLPPIPGKPTKPGEKWIGKYQIKKELARGGMGIVYIGEDAKLKRTVAIKVLLTGANATEKERERFLREAQMAAKLSHPRLVGILDTGICEEGDYFVMEYFPGRDLDKVMDEQGSKLKNNMKFCCQIAIKILEGLENAHQQNVLHRDLKPANILLKGPELKIADFGLAQEINPEQRMTQAGTFMGTPIYCSPEQIQGRLDEMDGRSDIYSVAIILYEMLTELVPYRGKTFADISKKIVYDEPKSPRYYNDKIPKDLETILLKMIEKKKEDRYPSAKAFREDLEAFIKGEPISAVPRSPIDKLMRKAKRHKAAIITGALAFIIIIYLASSSESKVAKVKEDIVREQEKVESDEREEQLKEAKKQLKEGNIASAKAIAKELAKKDQLAAAELLAKAEKMEMDKINSLIAQGKSFIDQKNWAKAIEKLAEAKREDTQGKKRSDIQKLLDIAQADRMTFQFKTKPKNIDIEVFAIERRSKSIEEEPLATGTTNTPLDVPLAAYYMLKFSANGYFPYHKIVTNIKKGSKQKIKVKLLSVDRVPAGFRNMVYIPKAVASLGASVRKKTRKVLPLGERSVKHFLIDRYEVTNEEYKKYLAKSGKDNEEHWPSHWEDGDIPEDKEKHPVVNITWIEAKEYADFYGKDLPTNIQWELSARSTDGRLLPWGTSRLRGNEADEEITCLFSDDTVEVGSMEGDLSPYGVVDLAGNAAEWIRDKDGNKALPVYIARGGAFSLNKRWITRFNNIATWGAPHATDKRTMRLPEKNYIGFRCVKELK